MSASSQSIPQIHIKSSDGQSLYEKLNSKWHERALQVFMDCDLRTGASILCRLGRFMRCIGRARWPMEFWGSGIRG